MTTAQRKKSETIRAKHRIPRFKTIEEAAAWFDSHDTAEFEDEFKDVSDDIRFVVSRSRPPKPLQSA